MKKITLIAAFILFILAMNIQASYHSGILESNDKIESTQSPDIAIVSFSKHINAPD